MVKSRSFVLLWFCARPEHLGNRRGPLGRMDSDEGDLHECSFRGNNMHVRFQACSTSQTQHKRDFEGHIELLTDADGWFWCPNVEPVTVRRRFQRRNTTVYCGSAPPTSTSC